MVERARSRSSGPAGGGGTEIVTGDTGFTDAFEIAIKATDTTSAPTDGATYQIALAQSDSVATPTEAVSLGISGAGVNDSNATPTEARSATIRVWLSGAAGTDVDNPSNANGSNNGTLATISTGVLASNPEILTADLGINVPSGITFSSATLTVWFRAQTTLVTSVAQIEIRALTATFSDIVVFTQSTLGGDTNNLTTPLTLDLVAAGVDTLAKLQDTQFVAFTQDVAAGVTPAILTLDAASIDIVATSI